jgi:hypothetical protein
MESSAGIGVRYQVSGGRCQEARGRFY